MMEPISIHNVPAHLDATGRPKWDQQKRNPQSHEGRSGDSENQGDTKDSGDAVATDRDTPRPRSDGIVGTQVDLEA
jgi:hypothetical protein